MAISCDRCETLPDWHKQASVVYLYPPMGHSLGKLREAASAPSVAGDVSANDLGLIVNVPQGGAVGLFEALGAAMSERELADTRCLIKPVGAALTAADIGAVASLTSLVELTRNAWLLDVLAEERLTSYFQPIVFARDTSRAYAYECLLRWIDETGKVHAPGRLFQSAGRADLLFQLDRAARTTAVSRAAEAGITETLFVNFTPSAIYDPKNCLQTTLALINKLGLPRDRVVFEVIESTRITDVPHLRNILNYYRDHGFRVALDDLGAGYASLNLLSELKPNIVKIDIELVRDVHEDSFKAAIVRRIVELAHEFGIEVVAEGIESQGEADWLAAHGVDYLQGYLFAKPGPKPALIGAAN